MVSVGVSFFLMRFFYIYLGLHVRSVPHVAQTACRMFLFLTTELLLHVSTGVSYMEMCCLFRFLLEADKQSSKKLTISSFE